LGDNIFYGQYFSNILETAAQQNSGATIFGYHVKDPERFGIAELNKAGRIISIKEKPIKPKSNYAITGLYFYDNEVIDISKSIKPSPRGELEITDINNAYLCKGNLDIKILGRGFTWLDSGTHDSLLEASQFVQTLEERQGLKVACLEEIGFEKGWLDKSFLIRQTKKIKNNKYGEYLLSLIEKKN
tara:strand:- start:344 stop:901 length:558 start_codon:yes stop_codon:yes gene_type:complete